MTLDGEIAALVVEELKRARTLHEPMHSAHEGWAVLHEEVDELWDLVREREPRYYAMRKEAIQSAAMAIRFVVDVCEPHVPRTSRWTDGE